MENKIKLDGNPPENKAETWDWEEIWKEAERGAEIKDVRRMSVLTSTT